MIAYKLCRLNKGGEVVDGVVPEFISWQIDGEFCLGYDLGRTTEAKVGGILCFSDEYQAASYASGVVLMVEVEGPVRLGCWSSLAFRDGYDYRTERRYPSYEDRLAKLELAWSEPGRAASWPNNSVAYRKVKPVQVVYRGSWRVNGPRVP